MSTVRVNLNGIHEIDFPTGVSSASTSAGVTTINLTGTIPSGPANEVYATPDGSSGNASLRALVMADLPADVVISNVTLRVASGTTLTTGNTKTFAQIDFPGTIVGWSLTADQAGSASVDVWKVASSAPPAAPTIPNSTNKISATAGPSLSSAQSASQNAAGLTGWTTAVAANDVFGFSIASATTVTAITLQIWIQRS